MFSRVLSATILGIECYPVQVEADVSDGLPVFNMVGYLSSQVREAQDRVKAALRNVGILLPAKRITINLSPGDIKKEGSRFDLPIAAAILASLGQIPHKSLENIMMIGEVSLDGTVNQVAGVLAIVAKAKEIGCSACMIPRQNLEEGQVVEGIHIIGVASLSEAVDYLREGTELHKGEAAKWKELWQNEDGVYEVDFCDIRGQEGVKRAAVIAACGFHNLLLIGPPGAGKTMISKRLPTILPMLTIHESIEISKIYSIAGLLDSNNPILRSRPFRAPHHTVTPQALAGGGLIPKPGEITLAHRGIMFLDELPEFSKASIEILRQPIEEHQIHISRTSGSFTFPAHILLLAAMNPCKCGYYPDMNRCICKPSDINRYLHRISKPFLDRIDLCVEVPEMKYEDMAKEKSGESSAEIRMKVKEVHRIQKERFQGTNIQFNSEIPVKDVEKYCVLTPDGEKLLKKAFGKMGLSARGYHRILKTARTIADLDTEQKIGSAHLSEAICYRSLDERYWKK